MKAQYTAPVLRSHGTVEAMTKGNKSGTKLDQGFPVNTPLKDITLS